MNIYATIYDNVYGKLFDISEVISDISVTTSIEDNPGKCTFKVIRKDGLAFWEGATVSIQIESDKIFKGFVFSKKRDQNVEIIEVTAYDQLRYLKFKDSKLFEGKTSSQIFTQICSEQVLKYKVVDASSYICAPKSHDAVELYNMVKTALDDTLVNTGTWYIVRDNFGVLEHVNIMSLISPVVLGDGSGITDLNYETSIDKDTYNQIKLYRDNQKTGKREIFIVNDTVNGGGNLKRWGILQLYEKVDESLNIAQIEQRARGMLKLYNNTKRSLKLEGLGHNSIFAGAIFTCKIADLGDLSMNTYLLATECTHNYSNGEHTMSITAEVVK